MHINAKRLKKKINSESATPAYLKIRNYEERAALLGIEIKPGKGKYLYTIEGGFLDIMGDPPQSFESLQALKAEINSLWEIATEPEIEYYIDQAGRCRERVVYPALSN